MNESKIQVGFHNIFSLFYVQRLEGAWGHGSKDSHVLNLGTGLWE
jgi:hypothetical protein